MNARRCALAWIASSGLLAALPAIHAQEGARVSGWTLNEDGSPLAGVEVVLACPPNRVRRTVSDASGRFDLTNLPRGNCNLRGTKAGYVDDTARGDPDGSGHYALKVAEGVWRDGFELRLARGVIVSGRVLDMRGRPARNVRVHPIRRDKVSGKITPLAYRSIVGDDGAFEFATLPPGEYYFGASPRPEGGDGGGSSGYAITYFPGTTEFAQAKSVVLKAGTRRRVDLTLLTTRAFTVSGAVHDFTGRPVRDATLVLSFEKDPQWMSATARTGADGTFTLTGVQPGIYVLRASRTLPERVEVHVDVIDADVGPVIVRMGPGR